MDVSAEWEDEHNDDDSRMQEWWQEHGKQVTLKKINSNNQK